MVTLMRSSVASPACILACYLILIPEKPWGATVWMVWRVQAWVGMVKERIGMAEKTPKVERASPLKKTTRVAA